MINATVKAITERLIERSRATRDAFLARTRAQQEAGKGRTN